MKEGLAYLAVATVFAAAGAFGGYRFGYQQAQLDRPAPVAEVRAVEAAAPAAPAEKKEKAEFKPTTLTASELSVIPGLAGLDAGAQEKALYILNNVPGACQPCMDTGRSLGRCLLDDAKLLDRTLCRNVPKLAARTVRLAKAGKAPDEIRAQVEFTSPWVPLDPGAARPSKGPADAPVTLVEISDFQCPYCKKSQTTLTALDERYAGKLRWVFVHLPLAMHEAAKPAALGAFAAQQQGKFWPFHDALFASEGLDDAKIRGVAQNVGLDLERWEADRASIDADKAVAADVALAEKYKITSTPTFFVNGYKVKGNQPIEVFARIVDAELEDIRP
ncbi:MAG: DsbA family protein [Myxococcota bacterium]